MKSFKKMKAIKVFYNGEPLNKIYPYATKWEVVKYRTIKILRNVAIFSVKFAVVCLAMAGSYQLGSYLNPTVKTVFAEKLVEVETIPPVMQRIAKCESGGIHKKNGQVVFNSNTNKTVDIGKYQINSIWNKKATELGLDLTVEKDNEKFAMWLYKNYGTSPWESSRRACWDR